LFTFCSWYLTPPHPDPASSKTRQTLPFPKYSWEAQKINVKVSLMDMDTGKFFQNEIVLKPFGTKVYSEKICDLTYLSQPGNIK
jgi:hypothetical protein